MRQIACFLAVACVLAVLINEGIRNKYGFISNRHFVLFWGLWASALIGMAVAVSLFVIDVL